MNFGSGTDPIEGANLAISILEYFYKKLALVVCTTHYQELKEFALVTPGFENASFEFDLDNLKPTYRLLLGVPGKSNAFQIGKKLGLPSEIIEKASSYINNEHISIEELLKSIYNDKLEIEQQKDETLKNLNEIKNLRKSLEKDQSDLYKKQQELIDNSKIEARNILLSAKEQVNSILKELHSSTIDSKKADILRNNLNENIKKLTTHTTCLNNNNTNVLKNDDIFQGLEVFIPILQSKGTVLSNSINKDNKVLVQVGSAKMNLKLSDLSLQNSNVNNRDTNSKGFVTTQKFTDSKYVSPEINVIGQTVDEAIYIIDKYLDSCIISNISPIRIIHGKGTRKIKKWDTCIFKKALTC